LERQFWTRIELRLTKLAAGEESVDFEANSSPKQEGKQQQQCGWMDG